MTGFVVVATLASISLLAQNEPYRSATRKLASFDARQLKAVAREFCSETTGVKLANLYVGTDDYSEIYAIKSGNHPNYEYWAYNVRHFFSTNGFPRQIAEVNRVGPNCGLRVRDGERVWTHVVSGKPPLAFSLAGCSLDLLEYRRVGTPMQLQDRIGHIAAFFYTQCPLSRVSAEAVRGLISRHLDPRIVVLSKVRNDHYFLTDEEFPMLYPYDTRTPYLDFTPFSALEWEAIRRRETGLIR